MKRAGLNTMRFFDIVSVSRFNGKSVYSRKLYVSDLCIDEMN